jgi:hypothetical protein
MPTLASSWLYAKTGEAMAEKRTAARAIFVLVVMVSLLYRQALPVMG